MSDSYFPRSLLGPENVTNNCIYIYIYSDLPDSLCSLVLLFNVNQVVV